MSRKAELMARLMAAAKTSRIRALTSGVVEPVVGPDQEGEAVMGMVERVADAIKAEMTRQMRPAPGPAGHAFHCDSGQLDMAQIARVAIGAMREPTETMHEAASPVEVSDQFYPAFRSANEKRWAAMIDTALKEGAG